VLLANERLAAWPVQHGGGWLGVAQDAALTYGLHMLYLATLLLCALLLRRLYRAAVESPRADPDAAPATPRSTSPHGLLFPYEAAFLAGGPPRVAETALAGLLEEGWVESSASGRIALGTRSDLVAALDPVAIAVLSVVAGGPPTAAREARRRAASLAELGDVGAILYARRLLVSIPAQRRLHRLRWAATGLLAAAGAALLIFSAARSSALLGPPVVLAAGLLVAGLAAPTLAWRRPFFRTALGEAELRDRCGAVLDKAHWVAGRVWSDQRDGEDGGQRWEDVDRIVDALRRPANGRPVQLGWLWGREDSMMAIAVLGPRGIADQGLQRGLQGGALGRRGGRNSTALSTPVHNMVGHEDP
jgi:uncharacterized protein (TIGR04222 family)